MVDRRATTILVLRLFGWYLVTVVFVVFMAYLMRTVTAIQPYALLAVPLGIMIGLVPLLRWYRRDAYPIGILYPLSALFLLRKCAPLVEAWLNAR